MVSAILVGRTPLSARILEPSEVIVVPAKAVVELIGRDPGFACAVAHALAGECSEIIENFKSHRLRTTIERVARWILRCDKDSGGTGWQGAVLSGAPRPRFCGKNG